jgi:hypothetical protein
MTERERLARIFGIQPLRPLGAVLVSAAISPVLWIGSGLVGVGLIALYIDERRRIGEHLAEVDDWGFSVTGYRAWLLAREPTFDLELRRDVASELIAGAFAAVDARIRVERRGERVVRVAMPRVEIRGGERLRTFLSGDRRRLLEVRDRVLAPLHADVGIAGMRMGDRESLAALVVSPAGEANQGAFRDQAKAAPPELQSLVHAGTTQLRPPRESQSLGLRVERLLYATGQHPPNASALVVAAIGGSLFGAFVGPLWLLLGAASSGALVYGARWTAHSRVAKALASVAGELPFPVEGYDDWLLSGRPIMDVEFERSPARADVERRLRSSARVADVTWLSDTLLRLESLPILHVPAHEIPSFWGGDPRELQMVARRVLVPLHDTHRVVAVRMGGYLDRRA